MSTISANDDAPISDGYLMTGYGVILRPTLREKIKHFLAMGIGVKLGAGIDPR
jgi:hypothetical protein